MDWTKTHGTDKDSWYRIRLMVQTLTQGIDMAKTHGMDIDLWY